ncbi:hypothetical protein [Dyadobacter tibetensis]|uniref:hypothetical protein n=1 Tax=Dyadobacter tibetensis TaxID=1211851 RepID=UPI00046E5A10|nr:hypothetical protein [Dyadobacter tibetensis]
MSNGLNINAIEQYASGFTTLVLTEAYGGKNIISGADLLKITPVRQVNLGILNRLFETWKGNAMAFRSPYFDFENEEVQAALSTFMNTVSQHIAVKRADLEPLLKASTIEAVELLLYPAKYFKEKISVCGEDGFDAGAAEQLYKYTHIHKGIAEKLKTNLLDSGKSNVRIAEALNWLDEALPESDEQETLDGYISQFNEIRPLRIDELLGAHPSAAIQAPMEEPSPSAQKAGSFFDSALNDIETSNGFPQPVKAERSVAVLSEIVSKSTQVERESLNNRFKVDLPKPSQENSYGSVPVRVETIAGSIPLGQRFMFVNQLFNKNSEHFDKAIYELDTVKSFEEAKDLIWHRYASKYAWDVNGEAVGALLAIVKRKFQ